MRALAGRRALKVFGAGRPAAHPEFKAALWMATFAACLSFRERRRRQRPADADRHAQQVRPPAPPISSRRRRHSRLASGRPAVGNISRRRRRHHHHHHHHLSSLGPTRWTDALGEAVRCGPPRRPASGETRPTFGSRSQLSIDWDGLGPLDEWPPPLPPTGGPKTSGRRRAMTGARIASARRRRSTRAPPTRIPKNAAQMRPAEMMQIRRAATSVRNKAGRPDAPLVWPFCLAPVNCSARGGAQKAAPSAAPRRADVWRGSVAPCKCAPRSISSRRALVRKGARRRCAGAARRAPVILRPSQNDDERHLMKPARRPVGIALRRRAGRLARVCASAGTPRV
jgi:hypothetical protein